MQLGCMRAHITAPAVWGTPCTSLLTCRSKIGSVQSSSVRGTGLSPSFYPESDTVHQQASDVMSTGSCAGSTAGALLVQQVSQVVTGVTACRLHLRLHQHVWCLAETAQAVHQGCSQTDCSSTCNPPGCANKQLKWSRWRQTTHHCHWSAVRAFVL